MATLILRDTIANEHFEMAEITLDVGPVDFLPVTTPVVCVAKDGAAFDEGLVVGVVEPDQDDIDRFIGFALPFMRTSDGFEGVEPQVTSSHKTAVGASVDLEFIIHNCYELEGPLSPRGAVTIRV